MALGPCEDTARVKVAIRRRVLQRGALLRAVRRAVQVPVLLAGRPLRVGRSTSAYIQLAEMRSSSRCRRLGVGLVSSWPPSARPRRARRLLRGEHQER